LKSKKRLLSARIISLILVVVMVFAMIPLMELKVEAYAKAYPVPELTGNQAQDMVNVAMSQLGYSEGSDGGTVYGAWWSTVTKWGDYTYSGWCAMFACWCANQIGVGMNIGYDKNCAVVQNLRNFLKNNGTVSSSFSTKPKPGDYIFFGYKGNSSASHVAIVVDYNAETNIVTFVGGNQSNKVKQSTITWSSSGKYGSQIIFGIGRPNYKNITIPDKPVVSIDKSAALKGDTVTVSWATVSNATSYSVAVYKDDTLLTEKNVGTKNSYKIASAAPGAYTVKVTAINDAGASGAGVCKFNVGDMVPAIRFWLSDSQEGTPATEYKIGKSYFLCYQLLDEISGKALDDVREYDYDVKLVATAPDGKVILSENEDEDNGSEEILLNQKGSYVFSAEVTGDVTLSDSFAVDAVENPKRIHISDDNVILNRESDAKTATIYVWSSGYYGEATVLAWQRDNSNASCTWGKQLEDGRYPLAITANAAGTTVITLFVKASATGEVLDTATVTVTVDAKTYRVSYDANGGTDAPEAQVKTHAVNLALSGDKPSREGFVFLGWAMDPNAGSADFQPGTNFLLDADTTLYAVWSETFLTGDANVDGTVNMKDWNCLYEHSNEVAEITGSGKTLADVNCDGKINLKDWTRLYEHICETNPLW